MGGPCAGGREGCRKAGRSEGGVPEGGRAEMRGTGKWAGGRGAGRRACAVRRAGGGGMVRSISSGYRYLNTAVRFWV